MKRVVSLFLSVLLLFLLCLPAAAAEPALPAVRTYTGFSDVPQGAWYESALKLCYEAGVLNTTTNIRPGGNNSKTVVTGPNGVDATCTVDYNFIEYTSPITLLMAIILLLYMKNIKVNKGKN